MGGMEYQVWQDRCSSAKTRRCGVRISLSLIHIAQRFRDYVVICSMTTIYLRLINIGRNLMDLLVISNTITQFRAQVCVLFLNFCGCSAHGYVRARNASLGDNIGFVEILCIISPMLFNNKDSIFILDTNSRLGKNPQR